MHLASCSDMSHACAALSLLRSLVGCVLVTAVLGCGDDTSNGASPDAAARDARAPRDCPDAGDGPAVEGCPCDGPAVEYCCYSGSGHGRTCSQHVWSAFVDGPCGAQLVDDAAAATMPVTKVEGIECR